MQIISVQKKKKEQWNQFIADNFPPVGAFLQTWQWGDFKEKMNLPIERYALTENGKWIGCFQLEIHKLPFGVKYGYSPRGPVFKKKMWTDEARINEALMDLSHIVTEKFPHLVFVRFEPPYQANFRSYSQHPYKILPYYLQPRFNQTVPLVPQNELVAQMSGDVRHDIRAAERLQVITEVKEGLSPEEVAAFEEMKKETAGRSGKNIFPSSVYFANLLDSLGTIKQSVYHEPYLKFFVASKGGLPVALYMAVFFACTVTYLYGASYSGEKSKRAPAYLHYKAMLHAKEQGYDHYDLGGVDQKLWPGLTYFKRQFGGKTMEYIGTVDVVIRPLYYWLYSLIKRFK
jgi:lipid II:glycine glycyltransferase (peptidoglycan interpeptide bridge formation enzyme)